MYGAAAAPRYSAAPVFLPDMVSSSASAAGGDPPPAERGAAVPPDPPPPARAGSSRRAAPPALAPVPSVPARLPSGSLSLPPVPRPLCAALPAVLSVCESLPLLSLSPRPRSVVRLGPQTAARCSPAPRSLRSAPPLRLAPPRPASGSRGLRRHGAPDPSRPSLLADAAVGRLLSLPLSLSRPGPAAVSLRAPVCARGAAPPVTPRPSPAALPQPGAHTKRRSAIRRGHVRLLVASPSAPTRGPSPPPPQP